MTVITKSIQNVTDFSCIVYRIHSRGLRHNLTEYQFQEISKNAHGFVGADLAALCNEAAFNCLRRTIERNLTVADEDEIWVSSHLLRDFLFVKSPVTHTIHN